LSRQTRILAGGDVSRGIDKIEQMMRYASSLGGGWLRRSNLEFAVHGDGIAIDHFAMKALREGDSKSRLSTRGWT
jgi:hypothetical protein